MTPNNNQPNALKSPYFRNAREADDFEDKVNRLRDKPFALAIGFDADPNEVDSPFEIACRKIESEGEMISSLVYVISRIAEQRGLSAVITFKPNNPETHKKIIALANDMANKIPINAGEKKNNIVRGLFGFFRKPPEDTQTV